MHITECEHRPALRQEAGDAELMVADRPERRYSADAYAAMLIWGAAVILGIITLGVDLSLLR
jgi:hypothetical protein